MNRSYRRSAVTSWTVTAGVVCGAAGLLMAAPAAADLGDAGADVVPGTHEPVTRGSAATSRLGARATQAEVPGGRPGRPVTRPDIPDTRPWPWPWPCHHWYWPPLLPPVDGEVGNRNAFFLGDVGGAPAVPPSAVVTAVSVPGLGNLAGPPESPVFPAAESAPSAASGPQNPPQSPAQGPPQSLAMHAPRGGPMIPAPPTPAPPPRTPRPASAPPAPPTPPPATPQAAALADVAAQALPGLVGLATLTAAGGLLGYRQAKAGFALRAAGTAGFLP